MDAVTEGPAAGEGGTSGQDVDVLVVGGGPAGMTTAGDLARAGRSVAVLERWPQINPSSRAFATMARTLELLDSRGLAEDLLAHAATAGEVKLFGGAAVDLTHLRSHYQYGMITPQTNVDQALGRYAVAQGAQVHRGVEAIAVDQDASGVTVTAQPKGSTEPDQRTTWRARYVVGADGAHSTVRSLLGLDFPGKAVLSSVVLADVRLSAGPGGGGLTLGSTPTCFGFLVPYGRLDERGGAWYRSMTWDRHHQVADTEPVGDGEVRDVLLRSMGRDVGVQEVGWHSRFHCDERQVRSYRHGRVFLAGDAAHVHSPMGGQGMNTGIQDAVNLAWKLDAALGGADDAVLDTYQEERHPIGRLVLLQSGLMMRGVTLAPRAGRALRDAVAPTVLKIPPVRDLVAGSFAGTELRYRRHRGQHRLVGTRATEVPLREGRLTRLQRAHPGFVLVQPPTSSLSGSSEAPGVFSAHRTDAGPAMLVRPDGYVAWAASGGEDSDGWRPVLHRWTSAVAA